MSTTLAAVLRHFGPRYLSEHDLSPSQAKAWRAIVACRTQALGGQHLRCDHCGAQQWRWHSCRNRHCPRCQAHARDAWRTERMAELLNVPYCHLVFTLPHELNALAGAHARWVYETLMRCTAATLTEFAANPRWLGGIGAFTLVLHTWTQDLRRHLHVHALMACGAWQHGGGNDTWIQPKRERHFLFPIHALSRVFSAKFRQALHQAIGAGKLPRDPANTETERRRRMQALRKHQWVVYAKTPLAGPASVLDYLSRYTHRTAIGNERLVAIAGDKVLLRVRTDETGGKRVIALDAQVFISRFMQHILSPGFKRIRHYGLLAPAAKAQRLDSARRLLSMPVANPQAQEDVRTFMRRVSGIEIDRCSYCLRGRWIALQSLPAGHPDLADLPRASCRGPP